MVWICACDRRADRRHAQAVLADAAQRQPERRMNEPPRDQENEEQSGERVAVGGVAVEIEANFAEQRPGMNALQAVEAAGEPAGAVGGFLQHQADAERDHDQRQVAKPRDDEARQIAEQAGGNRRGDKPGQRLAPATFRKQPRRIGADAEIGGVAERYDAGKAEDEIERQREQSRDRDLARQHQIIRRQHERQQRREPERDLAPLPAVLRLQILNRIGLTGDRRARHA